MGLIPPRGVNFRLGLKPVMLHTVEKRHQCDDDVTMKYDCKHLQTNGILGVILLSPSFSDVLMLHDLKRDADQDKEFVSAARGHKYQFLWISTFPRPEMQDFLSPPTWPQVSSDEFFLSQVCLSLRRSVPIKTNWVAH